MSPACCLGRGATREWPAFPPSSQLREGERGRGKRLVCLMGGGSPSGDWKRCLVGGTGCPTWTVLSAPGCAHFRDGAPRVLWAAPQSRKDNEALALPAMLGCGGHVDPGPHDLSSAQPWPSGTFALPWAPHVPKSSENQSLRPGEHGAPARLLNTSADGLIHPSTTHTYRHPQVRGQLRAPIWAGGGVCRSADLQSALCVASGQR